MNKITVAYLLQTILILILFMPRTIGAYETDVFINIDSPSVIRSGNNIITRVTVNNMNDNTSIILTKIDILNSDQTVAETIKLNRTLNPIKKEVVRLEGLKKQLNESYGSPELWQEYQNLSLKVENETFSTSFNLDINDFVVSPKVLEEIIILIKLEFISDNQTYVVDKQHSVKYSEALPNSMKSPKKIFNAEFVPNKKEAIIINESIVKESQKIGILSALPSKPSGWYAGDQHVHSKYGTTCAETPDPLLDMVSASISQNLDWIIFTDHSVALTEMEWIAGYNDCNSKSTSTFKCLYGQEISVYAGWLDQAHFLAYPYTDDYLGYVNGICTNLCLNCRDAQTVMNEVNNAGGMSFIAHPYDNLWNWEDWSVTGYTGLEIWNADWSSDDDTTITKWKEFLNAETNPNDGFIVGVSNSDAHKISDVGKTFTYCYLNSLTTNEIRNTLKNGHCVASNGPLVFFTIQNTKIGEEADVCLGNNIIHMEAYSNSEFGTLDKAEVYVDGTYYGYVPLSGYSYVVDITGLNINSSNKYVYVKLEMSNSKYLAYTNPLWLDVHTSDYDKDGTCDFYDSDDDNDGVPDNQDACNFNYGTYCHGCPQPNCGTCKYAYCPSSGAPYCANYDTSTQCNSNYQCSYGTGDNYYNVGGEYLCQGYCDGSGSCDYANTCSYDIGCDPDDDNDGINDVDDQCNMTYGQIYENGCPDIIAPMVFLNISNTTISLLGSIMINCTVNDTDPSPVYNLTIVKPSNISNSTTTSSLNFNQTNESGYYDVICSVIDGGNNSNSTATQFLVKYPDKDDDGFDDDVDCDDNNASVHPGALEECNNIDDNCNGEIDEGLTKSCGSGDCKGTQTCSTGIWNDCSSKDIDCGICASCSSEGECIYDETQDVDCDSWDLPEIASCYNDPDNNPFTWDYAAAFDSVCAGLNQCTWTPYLYTHFCNKQTCNAECVVNVDCPNKCVDNVYYYNGNCNSTCECAYQTEDCNQYNDDWYNTSNTRWINIDQCSEKEQKEQEYREFGCNINGCSYTVTATQWIDTGATRNKQDAMPCDDGLYCTMYDSCKSGVCSGISRYCNDDNICTLDSCNEETDSCEYTDEPSTEVCGIKDCNDLDTECRNYNSKTRYCDGSGNCQDTTCDSYYNLPSITQCGTDYFEYGCPDGNDLGDDTGRKLHDYHCDGQGSCIESLRDWVTDEECPDNYYCEWDGEGDDDENYYCKKGPTTMTVYSPEDGIYSTRRMPFNITTTGEVEEIEYTNNDDLRPRWKMLCRDCDEYGHSRSRLKTLREGANNITIRATDVKDIKNISLFIDSKDPRIRKTEPIRGFTNGSFYVEFSEENPKKLVLHYGNSFRNYEVDLENCYEERRNTACNVNVDLEDYDGKEIEYWFNIIDIADNYDESRHRELIVDTTPPLLNNPDSFWEQGGGRYSRYIYFTFNITEENFDEVSYYDENDLRPRWRRLCSRLRDGMCGRRKYFRKGEHSLSIQVVDKAGNIDSVDIYFNVSY